MTQQQLEAIYKANVDLGHIEALEALYTQGYYDGAGLSVTAMTPSIVGSRPAPTTVVKLKKSGVKP
jgi:hypothetical protein